jgi:hypothetical protein
MKKDCSRCGGKEYRRLNRKGFLEKKLLTFFNIYPWECALCRHKVYLRSSGLKKDRRIPRTFPSSSTPPES